MKLNLSDFFLAIEGLHLIWFDPNSNSKIGNPLSSNGGNSFSFSHLMKLADKHAVRYLKIMTCNNIGAPLGMGLWEGVPLRQIIWETKPKENIRRVFYYGHHNNDPKQMFRSSLPIGRPYAMRLT